MARYLPDYPVGNGQFENLNPVPIVEHLPKASAPRLSIREQIRLEMELSRREQTLDDDDDDDFDFEDDPYAMEYPEYADVADVKPVGDTAEKEAQDAPPAVSQSEASAGAEAND